MVLSIKLIIMWKVFMKRAFDFFISCFAIILLSPILIFIYFLIKRDGGSAIYKQMRVGLHGELFSIYKFRSMVINAEKIGGFSTQQNDPRVTKIGRFIRKTSIDELPQLFNVVKGDMSLVGPRPNVPAQKEQYLISDWQNRNSVLPGITGLAQATLRSRATFEERLKMDLDYVKCGNFLFDIKIILLTIKQVIFKGSF